MTTEHQNSAKQTCKTCIALRPETYERLVREAAENNLTPEQIVEGGVARYFRMLDSIKNPDKLIAELDAWAASRR